MGVTFARKVARKVRGKASPPPEPRSTALTASKTMQSSTSKLGSLGYWKAGRILPGGLGIDFSAASCACALRHRFGMRHRSFLKAHLPGANLLETCGCA
jgi:hypothetical protein